MNDNLKILIVDDEVFARKRIVDLLATNDSQYQIQEAEDGCVALDKIKSWSPDVVFLDIQMPELDGFDVLKALSDVNFSVVFQTAYDQFAVKAFDVCACDYLVKPFTEERFHLALKKAILGKASNQEKLKKLLETESRYLNKLMVSVGNTAKIFRCDTVNYFYSESHSTSLHNDTADYVVDFSLQALENKLDPRRFKRIHRNAIINLGRIQSVNKGNPMSITMIDGRSLKVSRDRKKDVMESIKSALF